MTSKNRRRIEYQRLDGRIDDMHSDEDRDDGLGNSVENSGYDYQENQCQNGDERRTGSRGRLSGILVVISAFCIQVLVFGTSNSIGVYNIQFLRAFDTGNAAVSLIGSINLGMLLGAGPVSSVLLTKMSHRLVALIGTVFTSLGLICMPFALNLPYMYFFYGILAGLGFSLVYIPSFILSGLFYDKHRSLATGIVSAGAGLGSTLFPYIFYQLIEFYGWRGSLVIVAGINLHLFVFVALMRPAPAHGLERTDSTLDRESERLLDQNKDYPPFTNESNNEVVETKTGLSTVAEPPLSRYDTSPESITSPEYDINNDVIVEQSEISSTGTGNRIKCHSFRQHFKIVFTFDFVVYIISNLGWNAGGGILLIFLPTYMTHIGLSEEQASLAFSLFGAFRCFGCLAGGFLGNTSCCDRLYLYILSNVGAGLVTLGYNLEVLNSLYGQLGLIVLFGFLFGIILSLQVSMTCDLIGTEALGHGFGVLMLANGAGIFAGPPIGGALIDHMNTQMAGVTLSGAFTIFGGLVMAVVPICRNTCRRKRRQQKYPGDL